MFTYKCTGHSKMQWSQNSKSLISTLVDIAIETELCGEKNKLEWKCNHLILKYRHLESLKCSVNSFWQLQPDVSQLYTTSLWPNQWKHDVNKLESSICGQFIWWIWEILEWNQWIMCSYRERVRGMWNISWNHLSRKGI